MGPLLLCACCQSLMNFCRKKSERQENNTELSGNAPSILSALGLTTGQEILLKRYYLKIARFFYSGIFVR